MTDLQAARDSLVAFAAMVGSSLEDWQARALELEARVTTIVAPRQSGKSRSLAVLALWSAFRRREQRVLLVSAGEEAGRRLLAEVRRIATASPLLAGSVVDEQAGFLALSNGSEVRSVPASERQIRGWTVDLLLVDEAAMVPDDLLLGASFPTTAARPDARIVLASSATVASGAFYDHAVRGEQGSEHVRTYRWALADAWWISPSTIAAARESMTETRFAAEYEGVFASGADALFSRQALERVTVDYVPSRLAELHGPARYAAGVDWGATTDRSALVALGRLPEAGEAVFGVACAERWPAGARLVGDERDRGVVEQIAASPAPFHVLTGESNGLGFPLAQSLFRKVAERPLAHGGGLRRRFVLVDPVAEDPFRDPPTRPRGLDREALGFATLKIAAHVNAAMKASLYSTLRMLVERRQLLLPASATELRRELELLRVDLSPSGGERIQASSGHDDLADALALSLGPFQRVREWRTIIGDLAGRGSDGAGHRGAHVPTFPEWASVAGAEVTAPPSPPGLDPFADARARVRDALQRTPTGRT